MSNIKSFITTFLILLPIDAIWLVSMKSTYDKWFSAFARTLNIPATVLVYIFIPFGLSYLVVSKHIGHGPSLSSIFDAFVFGTVSYGVYDLTNMATLKGWSPTMCIVDIIWGGVLCVIVSSIALFILSK